ncbi:phosphotransferase family protein [Gordonia sp. KTR9]|uniref:phosphotransferase family protein n=1 Tax=Gordonia sp. KTR9 TaxID=337191 RepID=UPI00027DDE92|nr:phosphotransferase family protein [Gordonia sp. KTR9]AFR49453.1 putative aminoglycoside phosphotransferase [Gordonia sp. KTR9]
MTGQANPDDISLDTALVSWISRITDSEVVKVERRPGGGRREAWYVDSVTHDGRAIPLFLRYDRETPEEKGDPFTLHREAKLYEAFNGTGIPMPHVIGVHPTEQAILSTRVTGHPWFSALTDEGERVSVASEFMRTLAAMHCVDPHRLDLPDQNADMDLRELVDHEIDVWEAIYRGSSAEDDPLIDLGLDWLRRNRPAASGPVVIVQGDTGPGNFLYENGRVTAVLDLEMGHLGDPHDDLAWVSLRAVQEPFTNLRDRLTDYADCVSWDIDLSRIRYYRVFAELRVVILGHKLDSDRSPLSEVGNQLAYGLLHRRLLIEALTDVLGLTVDDPAELDAPPGPDDWLYNAALEQIRQIIVPRSTDDFVISRSKGLARILKYLRQSDRYKEAEEAADLEDIRQILPQDHEDVATAIAALAQAHQAGSVTDAQIVGFFARQVARSTEVLRPAMGVLADRHFDPLD